MDFFLVNEFINKAIETKNNKSQDNDAACRGGVVKIFSNFS